VQTAHVVEKFATLFETYGFPRMSGRILAQLMVSEGPGLTAGELAESLQVSAAAVSTSTTYLVQVGLVEKHRLPGERRDRYHLPDDAWYLATASKNPFYGRIAEIAAEAVVAVGGPRTEAGERFDQMRDFFEFLQREVPVLVETWHDEWARRQKGSR
jgi:DNA-binding transcriptional regulator GbsR (MarR family)